MGSRQFVARLVGPGVSAVVWVDVELRATNSGLSHLEHVTPDDRLVPQHIGIHYVVHGPHLHDAEAFHFCQRTAPLCLQHRFFCSQVEDHQTPRLWRFIREQNGHVGIAQDGKEPIASTVGFLLPPESHRAPRAWARSRRTTSRNKTAPINCAISAECMANIRLVESASFPTTSGAAAIDSRFTTR